MGFNEVQAVLSQPSLLFCQPWWLMHMQMHRTSRSSGSTRCNNSIGHYRQPARSLHLVSCISEPPRQADNSLSERKAPFSFSNLISAQGIHSQGKRRVYLLLLLGSSSQRNHRPEGMRPRARIAEKCHPQHSHRRAGPVPCRLEVQRNNMCNCDQFIYHPSLPRQDCSLPRFQSRGLASSPR